MILVFIFLGIIIFLSFIFLILVMSSIRINIKEIIIKDFNLNKNNVFIELYLFDKIKYFSIKVKNINNKKYLDKFKNNSDNIKVIDIISLLNKLKITIKNFNLNMTIGLEDICAVSYLITITSSLISTILSFFCDYNSKIKYSIRPIYNENNLNINLESIISIKIVHIIYVIKILIKKRGKINDRTSYRRSYAYSNE